MTRNCFLTISVMLVAGCFQEPGGTSTQNGLCASDTDCGAKSVCVAGVCHSMTGYSCFVSADCRPPSTVCLGGTCQPGCTQDSDCPSGDTCTTSSGECTAPVAGPDAGTVTPGCQSNSDCSGGSVCLVGTCGPCSSSSQCTNSLVCVNGSCQSGCSSSSQCSNGQVCDSSTQQCRPCTSNTDCGGQNCVNGGCQAPCTSNSQCSNGEACLSGLCSPCTSASQCTTGQICASGACTACTANSQCATGQVCASGACGACTSAAQCGAGQTCTGGTCKAAPSCTSNSQCSSGQVCSSSACAPCPTWTNNINAFMSKYSCNFCHFQFGSQSGVTGDAQRVQQDIDDGRMPTGSPYPTATEITMIDNWFSSQCNMP